MHVPFGVMEEKSETVSIAHLKRKMKCVLLGSFVNDLCRTLKFFVKIQEKMLNRCGQLNVRPVSIVFNDTTVLNQLNAAFISELNDRVTGHTGKISTAIIFYSRCW